MINYFKASYRRKIARRITKEYPPRIEHFNLEKEGEIEFANWDNPLVQRVEITQSQVDFFKKFISKGDMVIDIGSNIGDTTVPIALAAGREGITLGFDPNPFVYKILEANAALNRDKTNIIPLPYAISAREEEFYFISSEASFSNGGISPDKNSNHGKFIYPDKIKGVNLGEMLDKDYGDQLDKLSFIKIDTEGYDKEILKSISDLVQEYKPIIIAESFGASSDEAKMELFQVIKGYGYDIFHFEDFEADAKVTKLQDKEEMTKWRTTINIYATPA